MHRSLPRVVLALFLSLVVTGAAVAVAGPAQADRWTYDDAAGDVTTEVMTENSITRTPVPEQANGDIVQVVAAHKARKVTIALRTRVPLTGPFTIAAGIRAPGKQLLLMSMKMPGFGGTELLDFSTMDFSTMDFANPGAGPKSCRGLKRTIGADRTTVRFSIPRSCLGNPRWFRFDLTLTTSALFTDVSYDDDGLRTGMTLMGSSKKSPKIKR